MSKKKRGITVYPGKGKLLCQCFLSFLGGWILAGAKVQDYALPLGACFIAAQSLHLRMWTGLAGVIGGYFFACVPVDAMEYSSLALLMPVSALLFQSTGWTEKKWFMPLCCGLIAGIFGMVRMNEPDATLKGLWIGKALLGAMGTYVCRRTLYGNRRAAVIFGAFLVLGLWDRGAFLNFGILLAVTFGSVCSELVPGAVMGMALDMCAGGGCYTGALLLPGVFCALLRVRKRELRSLAYTVLPATVAVLWGQIQWQILVSIACGGLLGYLVGGSKLLSTEARTTEEPSDRGVLEEAATVMELLAARMPQEQTLCPTETDQVFDGAAEQVCRKCAFFHRCWQTHGTSTYSDLSQAAESVMKTGFAKAEHFPTGFRKRCCNLDAFLAAMNRELEGMLYRRQYRLQLRESRRILSEDYSIMAKYLRTMSREVPVEQERRYHPLVSICSASKERGQLCGDRGACFMGRWNRYYILLSDGMGTGREAAQLSNYTVRLLQRLLCSGLPAPEAMKLLDGNMLLQGSGAFSTVDLVEIDLSVGKAVLYKWGSAPSYWRDGEELKKIGTATPPPGVGVGEEHLPQKYVLSLRGGEMLVLISDGAYGEETETAIASYRNASPQELAALLIGGMQAEDDMTAIVISLRLRTS